MNLQETAERLRQYKETDPQHLQEGTDHDLICEAVWDLYGDDAELSEHYDDDFVADGETRLYWVLPENEGEETILVYDGKIVVGTIAGVTAEINAAYCEKHHAQQCKACGDFSDKTCVECPHCGKYVDGTECGELTVPADVAECIRDGGSEEYLWLLKERLPTHETPANHTYVFLRLQLLPREGRWRGQYGKPEQWYASICCVNVGMAGKAGAREVQSSLGISPEDWKKIPQAGKAEALLDHGTYATVAQQSGVSPRRLLDWMLEEKTAVMTFGGFKLDAPHNAIGSSGWDFMKGDITAGIRKR